MSTADIPVASIKPQPYQESPLAGFADALVDDTVVLVDGANTLVGSQVTPVPSFRTKAYKPVTRLIINKKR